MSHKAIKDLLTEIALDKVYKLVGDNNTYNECHSKYNEVFEKLKEVLPEESKELLYTLDNLAIEARTITEETAYLKGLSDGIEINHLFKELSTTFKE